MESTGTKTLFVDTNLDTHLVTTVSDSDTVYDLKRKVILEHHQCFPTTGVIKIDGLKVKRRGQFYHLSDWMILKSVLAANKNSWFISVDASCLEQDVGMQHVDQHMEEDRLFKNELSSKKRTLVVQNDSLLQDATGSGPSVEKKRKTQDKETSVKASNDLNDESNTLNKGASCLVVDQVDAAVSSSIKLVGMETLGPKKTQTTAGLSRVALKYQGIREWILLRSSGVPASAFVNRVRLPSAGKKKILDKTLTDDVTMQEVEILKPTEVAEETSKKESKDAVTDEEKLFPHSERKDSQDDSSKDDIVTNNDAEKNLSEGNDKGIDEQSEKQEKMHNGEIGMFTAVSNPPLVENAKEHETTLLDAARKDSDESIRLNNGENCSDQVLADVSMAVEEIVPQEIPSEIHQEEKENDLVQKTNMGNESLSSSLRTFDCDRDASALGHLIGAKGDMPDKDESPVECADSIVSEIPPNEKNRDETKNDKISSSNAEKKEVLENTLTDDVSMQEVEIIKITEVVEETSNKELKDVVGRSAAKNDDAETLRAENKIGQGNDEGSDDKSEQQNKKTDVEKRKKRKTKTETYAKNAEVGMSAAVSDAPLNEHETTSLNAAKEYGDKVKGKDAQVSGLGLGTVSQVSESKDDVTQLVKVKKPKKKTKKQRLVDSRNDSAIQPRKLISESENKKVPTDVVNDPNIPNAEQFKTSKKIRKFDVLRTSKSTHANKAQKPTLGQASAETLQKSTPVVNGLQHVGGSADDNTSLGQSSSSGDSASSLDSRRNGYRVVKRRKVVGKDDINSQSKSKNISMRSSRRFKKAKKVSASQEPEDTESEHVEFVPESPPMSKR
ncbi:hypothetical protein CTI12_AA383950 [Artemisia annua]|uniref:Uncharacterized protein n=1 Tax=Artemisia annua TaxID=35608 RepID=A0A2U1MG72_ARTAN|nr:hypothetical protein CTI12_AA383950 [Artemisia annua]